MNQEIRLLKDNAKSITRIFHFDGEKKTHIGDIPFNSSEFIVCPDLEKPEKLVPMMGKILTLAGNSLNTYTSEAGLLTVSIFLL